MILELLIGVICLFCSVVSSLICWLSGKLFSLFKNKLLLWVSLNWLMWFFFVLVNVFFLWLNSLFLNRFLVSEFIFRLMKGWFWCWFVLWIVCVVSFLFVLFLLLINMLVLVLVVLLIIEKICCMVLFWFKNLNGWLLIDCCKVCFCFVSLLICCLFLVCENVVVIVLSNCLFC